MPAERYYLDLPLIEGQEVILPYPESHHLVKVMRTPVGKSIELINGHNQLAHASVLTTQKEIRLQITSVITQDPPPHKIILCQALPRLNRLETIVEKGTELGMTDLWLFPDDLSEKKTLTDNQLQRVKTIAITAIKQCGRLDLPEITIKPPLTEWDSLPYPAYFGDTDPEAPRFFDQRKKNSDICFFIGPESGFSKKEITELHQLKAQGVRLHPNILRTDTAPLVALTIINL